MPDLSNTNPALVRNRELNRAQQGGGCCSCCTEEIVAATMFWAGCCTIIPSLSLCATGHGFAGEITICVGVFCIAGSCLLFAESSFTQCGINRECDPRGAAAEAQQGVSSACSSLSFLCFSPADPSTDGIGTAGSDSGPNASVMARAS